MLALVDLRLNVTKAAGTLRVVQFTTASALLHVSADRGEDCHFLPTRYRVRDGLPRPAEAVTDRHVHVRILLINRDLHVRGVVGSATPEVDGAAVCVWAEKVSLAGLEFGQRRRGEEAFEGA